MKKYNMYKIIIWMVIILFFWGYEAFYVKNASYMGDYADLPEANYSETSTEKGQLVQTIMLSCDSIEGIVLTLNSSFSNQIKVVMYINNEKKQAWKISSSDVIDNKCKLVLDTKIKDGNGSKIKVIVQADNISEIPLSNRNITNNEVLTLNGNVIEDTTLCYSVLEKNISKKRIFIYVAVTTILALCIYIFNIYKIKELKIEKIFIYGYLIMGLIQIFAVPIFKTPDETSHFFRSYEISQGHLISKEKTNKNGAVEVGRNLPEALIFGHEINWTDVKLYDLKKMRQYSIDSQKETFIGFPNSALYAPATYLPQAMGIKIASFFSNNVLVICYAARFFNWLITGMLLLLAIHYIPIGKKLLVLIAFLPMNMQQFNSMSPDAFTFALCMSLLAFVLYLKYNTDEQMVWYHYLIMYILIILISQCKIVYILFCSLLFLIPQTKFKSKRKYYMHVIFSASIILILCLSWLHISSGLLVPLQPGVDSAIQLKNILFNPIGYLGVMLKTIDTFGDSWFRQMLGESLGWLNINTSYTLLTLYVVLIVVCFFKDNEDNNVLLKKQSRIFLLVSMFLIIALIFTSLYIQWTAVASDVIYGIQGRYFLPIIPPLLIALRPNDISKDRGALNFDVMFGMVLAINICIATILFTNAL